jgi:DNA repair exonuclease SbcCD ATPase subunit
MMNKEIKIGDLNKIYEKYGDLGFKVKNPYGYHNISWCGITEKNAEVYRCDLKNGMYVEGADLHKLKNNNGDFINLNEIKIGDLIETIDGLSEVENIKILPEKNDLFDIQVDDVHQYYSNGIVSHNTTFSVDSVKFLFFGKTTKTDKNEQIFNLFSDKNELSVRGMVGFDNKEIIIERKMTRSSKREGGFNIKNNVNYFEILPDGEEILMNDEDAKKTSLEIEKIVGNEKDFDITILATAKNLEDLIDSSPTESGKLLTRFIGLEILDLKEKAVREMYNSFSKTKQTNIYNETTLLEEISTAKEDINTNKELLKNEKNNLLLINNELVNLNNKKDELLSSKHTIDVVITQLNPLTLKDDVDKITITGKSVKQQIDDLVKEIQLIGNVEYNENEYQNLNKTLNEQNSKKIILDSEILKLNELVDQLVNGEFCPTCSKPLDNVDHSEDIKKNNGLLDDKHKELSKINKIIIDLKGKIDVLNETKVKVDKKNNFELKKERLEVELNGLREKIKSKNSDLKKYEQNKNSITFNSNVDVEVSLVKTDILVKEKERDDSNRFITTTELLLEDKDKSILNNELILKKIKVEEELEKIFKVYIEMMGKKGISKLVLRSVLPIINSELVRLMDDVCDFELELIINSKNEVEYLISKDGIEQPLKSGSGFEKTVSSIALRCVLGKLSHLPMPNFITFDEVISGTVAEENIPLIKPMFEKIKAMFDIVFFITHKEEVKNWADNLITINKINHISKLMLK